MALQILRNIADSIRHAQFFTIMAENGDKKRWKTKGVNKLLKISRFCGLLKISRHGSLDQTFVFGFFSFFQFRGLYSVPFSPARVVRCWRRLDTYLVGWIIQKRPTSLLMNYRFWLWMDQLENMNKDRRCYICSLINPSGVLEVNDSVNIVLKVSTERVTDTLTRSQIWCVSS